MRKIDETASAGSTSAGSIATVPGSRLGGMQTRLSLKDFMMNFYGRMNNRNKFAPVKMEGSINRITETAAHPYQLDDASSRLKSLQMQGQAENDDRDIVTYGIEDDEGCMMKVSVPIDQGEDFERHVAQCLADVLDFKKTGRGEDKTLAELLYELKDQFTIVNAEFPTIPKDAVYNANEITEDLPDAGMGDDEMGDDEMGDGEMGDEEGQGDLGDEDDLDMGDDDDADMGTDFDADGEDDASLLKSVLDMLKSQAERDIAQAKAKEEEAKAKQAEMALSASKREMQAQEQMVAAEAELEAEKDREKKAKKMAELAKYNIKKRRTEGFSSLFRASIIENLDPNDTPMTLQRDRRNLQQKLTPGRDADRDEAQFMQKRKQQALRINQIERQAAQDMQRQNRKMAQQQDQEPDQNNDQNNDQNQDRSARQPRGPQ